jgi:hypothetical protein
MTARSFVFQHACEQARLQAAILFQTACELLPVRIIDE